MPDSSRRYRVSEIRKFLDGPPCYHTIHRWRRVGVPGPNGERIKLEMFRIGGRYWVSENQLKTFLHKLNNIKTDE